MNNIQLSKSDKCSRLREKKPKNLQKSNQRIKIKDEIGLVGNGSDDEEA